MADLDVNSVTVPVLLKRLRRGQYRVPAFQREFVWKMPAVAELAWSVVRGRPIGMATFWESNQLEGPLLPHSIRLEAGGNQHVDFCTDADSFSGTSYAILDGQQRCTSLAMAFGGLATEDQRRRTSGSFFLDLDLPMNDDSCGVIFVPSGKLKKDHLESPSAALAQGKMPLSIPDPGSGEDWDFTAAWTEYIGIVKDPNTYAQGNEPSSDQKDTRASRILDAIKGMNDVKMATYTVGSSYTLSDICEIFETLNTTGTVVSTVDLIHSFVLQESAASSQGISPMNVRQWIDDLGEKDGAQGWASTEYRPEMTAQFVTAAYLGLSEKPPARPLGGNRDPIRSVKSGDLLRTPTEHWLSLEDHDVEFADTLGGFQDAVANQRFSMSHCPYPASAVPYVAMAWSKEHEAVEADQCWSKEELNALFRAFFWRNALSGRYDQGFLTKVAADLNDLRAILRSRDAHQSASDWAGYAEKHLDQMFAEPAPRRDELIGWIAQGTATGARLRAVLLAIRTHATHDVVSGSEITYPSVNSQMHHIYPKKWIKKNLVGDLAVLIQEGREAGGSRENCPANLMPLSEASNKDWLDKNPGQVFKAKKMNYATLKNPLNKAFIDKKLFDLLATADVEKVRKFQDERAKKIADHITGLMRVGF